MKILPFLVAMSATLGTSLCAQAFTTQGFVNPYGVVIDTKTNYIYVSNLNGNAETRDDNGFISRLKGDGTVDQMRFIDGANPKITLHAPKGMAIVGTTLYVTDIEKLHAFDVASGQPLFDVNFGQLPIQHLYDIKVGPDGALYAADGPGNTIYKIDVPKQHEVTPLVSGESVGQPHGVVYFPVRSSFVVSGWSSGQVTAYDRAGKRQPFAAIFLRTVEGIDADDGGALFVASNGLNAIFRIGPDFKISALKLGIHAPSGIAFHRATNQILVAQTDDNTVMSIPIPQPKPELPPASSQIAPLPQIEGGVGADGSTTPATKPEGTATPAAKPEATTPPDTKPPSSTTPAATPGASSQTPPPASTPAEATKPGTTASPATPESKPVEKTGPSAPSNTTPSATPNAAPSPSAPSPAGAVKPPPADKGTSTTSTPPPTPQKAATPEKPANTAPAPSAPKP